MRFESPGLLHFLKGLAIVGAYVLYFFVDWDIDELVYQFRRIDWLYATFYAGIPLILIGIPAFRLLREYKIWRVLYQPFRVIQDPFIDVDLKEESYGDIVLENGYTKKRAAIFVSKNGVIVRKAAYPKLFPTFEISWVQISNIYFAALQANERFGSDPFGVARVTLAFAEELILVLPWRRRFNSYIPDRIGLQKESLVE